MRSLRKLLSDKKGNVLKLLLLNQSGYNIIHQQRSHHFPSVQKTTYVSIQIMFNRRPNYVRFKVFGAHRYFLSPNTNDFKSHPNLFFLALVSSAVLKKFEYQNPSLFLTFETIS